MGISIVSILEVNIKGISIYYKVVYSILVVSIYY